jgi:parallel beta-helix repeat protein
MSRVFLRLALGVALASAPAYATVAVGTCQPQFTSFATITLAIAAVPPGTTIDVCPGLYPEQITINKKLTLKGVVSGNQAAAVITAPVGGVVQNSTSLATGFPIAAQILVEAATPVVLNNLVVDGSNNGITGCGLDLVGIYYRNASGSVTHASVVNQALGAGLTGCQSGLGIFVQSGGGTSTVTLSANYVHNFQKNGITGNEVGTTVTVTGNTVIGQGPTMGAAENSIQIGFGAFGTVTANVVGDDVWSPDVFGDTGDAAAGILVYASPNISVTGNTVSETQFGIVFSGDPVSGNSNSGTITSNKVATTLLYDGIDVCSNNNTVKTNTVTGSDEAGIHLDSTCGSSGFNNTLTSNTIHTACAGVLEGPGVSGNSLTSTTYINTTNQHVTGSDQCTPPAGASAHRAHGRPVGFRP